MMMRKYFAIADDVHAEVREGETGTVRGLSTVPKDSQNNELDLII